MSTIRQDTLTGRWVIVATGRGRRPDEFADLRDLSRGKATSTDDCPFCPGHENQTPEAVLVMARPDWASSHHHDWDVRVFPNKYPAVRGDIPLQPETSGPGGPEIPGVGGHEVVVCGPDHHATLGSLGAVLVHDIFLAVRERVGELAVCHPEVRHVLAFANQGPDAGATLAHPHLQIIATPLIPATVLERMEGFERHRDQHGTCLLCELLASEEAAGHRVVAANGYWVAVTPWASRYPYEMRLIPRRHGPDLREARDNEIHALGDMVGTCLDRLERVFPGVNYNLVFHGAALAKPGGAGYSAREGFHWHLEILPRLSRQAGFEAGTGFAINSVSPEAAAARLREEGS